MSDPPGDRLQLPPTVDTGASDSPQPRRWLLPLGVGAAAVIGFVVALAVAPAVLPLLPWRAAPAQRNGGASASPEAAWAARVATIEAAEAQDRQSTAAANAAIQRLEQRLAAVEARPVADLTLLQHQLAAEAKSAADAVRRLDTLERDMQAARANTPGSVGLVLTLLQIREAIDIGRPFAAEYETLAALLHDRADLAAAAAPLMAPAATGVATRAVLVERLRQLAPGIAAPAAPPGDGWRAEIEARLRSLVRIRRVAGSGQSPAEAAVSTAQRDLAAGNLAGAVVALEGLSGPAGDAAKPWLDMARRRLGVENSLHQLQTLAAARLANANADASR